MALPTSNLHLTDILAVLSVSTPKEIFYNGNTLKTLAQIKQVVNRLGLNSTYCTGATDTDRITNLLNDRKLSYLKGYAHTYISASETTKTVDFLAQTFEIDITSNCYFSISDNQSWITTNISAGSGNTTIEISVTKNTDPQRTGTITVTAETGELIEIVITQETEI